MLNDSIKVLGTLSVILTGADGKIKDQRELKNLVVTTGKSWIASRMVQATAPVIGWMAVGTNSTLAAAGDTALGAEVVLSRTALTSLGVVDNVVSHLVTFGPGVGTGALVEAGLFNDASAGIMLSRTTFATVNKLAADTLTIGWNITVA